MCFENGWLYFKIWWKSFTFKEKVLTIIESVLLVTLIVLILLVIFHFLHCKAEQNNTQTTVQGVGIATKIVTSADDILTTTDHIKQSSDVIVTLTDRIATSTDNVVTTIDETGQSTHAISTDVIVPTKVNGNDETRSTQYQSIFTTFHTTHRKITKKPKVTCTADYNASTRDKVSTKYEISTSKKRVTNDLDIYRDTEYDYDSDIYPNEDFYGEVDNDYKNKYKKNLAAFVKASDMKLSCPLTLLSKFWTLTAASCIENTKNVESIDKYIIIEDYHLDDANWRSHRIADMEIHPRFRGNNKSYDVAVLKTDDEMEFDENYGFLLPAIFDFLTLNIGDKLNVLGFGQFRNNTKKNPKYGDIVQTNVFVLPRSQCPYSIEEYEEISLRNIKFGGPNAKSMDKKDKPCCQETTICAGVLFRKRFPCYFCSGTPLFRGRYLMGIMGDNEECGVTCEPMHYVSVASLVEWLKFVMKM